MTRHRNVPKGQWVDVRRDQVLAPGTYVDAVGVLRSTGDGSCVVWHKVCQVHGHCERKGIQPNEIRYADNGSPWCPDCFDHDIVQCAKEHAKGDR